jgi:hypothetical protein
MQPFTLEGYITETGELRVALPSGIEPGKVKITIEKAEPDPRDAEQPYTDAEIAEMMRPEPKSGADIVALGHTGGWEHLGITDGVEWELEQRGKRRARQGW